MPKLAFSAWLEVLAPTGTPTATPDLLNRRLVEAVQAPYVGQKLVEAGFSVTETSRSENGEDAQGRGNALGYSGQKHRLQRRLSS